MYYTDSLENRNAFGRPQWVAFYSDKTGAVLFFDEESALRYAVDHPGMDVRAVFPGMDIFTGEFVCAADGYSPTPDKRLTEPTQK